MIFFVTIFLVSGFASLTLILWWIAWWRIRRHGVELFLHGEQLLRCHFDKPCCMCGRPLGCKRKNEKPDGWVDCDHVFGLSTRCHDRWPRWGPRSSPKHGCGFASRCNKRVPWIVGSTDRHLI